MLSVSFLVAAAAIIAPALAVPSLDVPACPYSGTIKYTNTVPNTDKTPFPLTQVDLCYDNQAIRLNFTAYNETNFFYNSSLTTNGFIFFYEVMEAFIYHGANQNDPSTYLEFEVAPNNVTFNSFIYNPSKVRAPGTPFDHFLIDDIFTDGLTAQTQLDRHAHIWRSQARIPLALFNIDDGQAKGTRWRMNFFRTITSPKMFPNQTLGAWSPPDAPNFHKTPFFGNVRFV